MTQKHNDEIATGNLYNISRDIKLCTMNHLQTCMRILDRISIHQRNHLNGSYSRAQTDVGNREV